MSSTISSSPAHPSYVAFGPNANCTLEVCPIGASVYGYRPSVPANGAFIALFGLSLLITLVQGVRWKTLGFTIAMFLGYITEIIGYIGRIMLYNNPFSFTGFMIQIVCITIGPVFFTAAIYLTLAKITRYLDPLQEVARFRPQLYYWIFIACDIISLTLQGTGGGMSTSSSGTSNTAIDIAIAGLSFQVITLTVFCILALDFGIRFSRHRGKRHFTTDQYQHSDSKSEEAKLTTPFKLFIFFLSLSILLILTRCAYRIDELSDGYNGPLIGNQGLFIALETVMVILATFCMNAYYPGLGQMSEWVRTVRPGVEAGRRAKKLNDSSAESSVEEAEKP